MKIYLFMLIAIVLILNSCSFGITGELPAKAENVFFKDDFNDGIISSDYKEYGGDAEWVEHDGVLEERKKSPRVANQHKTLVMIRKPIKNFRARVDFQTLSEKGNQYHSYIWWHGAKDRLDGIKFGSGGGDGRGVTVGYKDGRRIFMDEARDGSWDVSKCTDGYWCTWEVILKDNHYTLNLYYKTLGGQVLSLREGDLGPEWNKTDYYIGLGTWHRSEVRFDNFIVAYE